MVTEDRAIQASQSLLNKLADLGIVRTPVSEALKVAEVPACPTQDQLLAITWSEQFTTEVRAETGELVGFFDRFLASKPAEFELSEADAARIATSFVRNHAHEEPDAFLTEVLAAYTHGGRAYWLVKWEHFPVFPFISGPLVPTALHRMMRVRGESIRVSVDGVERKILGYFKTTWSEDTSLRVPLNVDESFAEALEIAKKYIAQRTRAFQPQSIQCRPEWVHPNNYWEFSEPSPKKVRPCWVVVYTADGNLLEVWIDIEKMVCVGGDRTRGLNRPGDR